MLDVCRNSFVVADRDDSVDAPPAKKWVRRIISELPPERCWITKDYEIEWYVPLRLLEEIWPGVGAEKLDTAENRERPFYDAVVEAGGPKSAAKEKVRYARRFAGASVDSKGWFGMEAANELGVSVRLLAEFIRDADDMLSAAKANTDAEP